MAKRSVWQGFVVLFLSVGMLTACGGGSSGEGGNNNLPPPSGTTAPTGLSYGSAQIWQVGAPVSLTPTVSGTVTSYSVSPALPAGLSLNASTGIVTGTPTLVTSLNSYAFTATNSAGSTSTTVNYTVVDERPHVSYSPSTTTLKVGVEMSSALMPSSFGPAVTSWSVDPALPSGLSFDSFTGKISGKPTVASADTVYVVTAANAAGSMSVNLHITVSPASTPTVLLELGHAAGITTLRVDANASRALSRDSADHWVLWNYSTGAVIAQASVASPVQVDLAGTTVAIETPNGVELRSSADGQVLATINAAHTSWQLASDGSYVVVGGTTSLTAWDLNGNTLFSRTGNYSTARVFAAPTEVRIARGAAGESVIETVTVAGGVSSVAAPFVGTFRGWYADGERFLTAVGSSVRSYSKLSAQLDIAMLSSVSEIGGSGEFVWIVDTLNTLRVYDAIGSGGTARLTLPNAYGPTPSGTKLAILSNGGPAWQLNVVDLGMTMPTLNVVATPRFSNSAYAASASSGDWLLGTSDGIVVDGTSLGANPRFLSHGKAYSIVGGTEHFAMSFASGEVRYFDTASLALEGTLPGGFGSLRMSGDGTVLGAVVEDPGAGTGTLTIYSLPTEAVLATFQYSSEALPRLEDFTLSRSGTVLGRKIAATGGGIQRLVTGVTGTPTLWSDSLAVNDSLLGIRLSPDGTRVATTAGLYQLSAATNVFLNGTLATAFPGWAVDWIDDGRLLVNRFVQSGGGGIGYGYATVVNAAGNEGTPLGLPHLRAIQFVSGDTVYSPERNEMFSVTTGGTMWSSAEPTQGTGAIAAGKVVFASGSRVLVDSY